jgi:spore coat protein U-like protein
MPTKPMKTSALACLLIAVLMQGAQALTCTVSSPGLAFGIYNPASAANRDATGTLRITCDGGVSAKITLSVGNGVGARYSTGRKMTLTSGTRTLTYNVYLNTAHSAVFGDGTDGSGTVQSSSSSTSITRTVYGRIPGSQTTALSGSYKDTLVVTIQY